MAIEHKSAATTAFLLGREKIEFHFLNHVILQCIALAFICNPNIINALLYHYSGVGLCVPTPLRLPK
jgi:hypothetical protein